ncbi:glycerophosphodiester phosphodiesterase [Bacillus sp. T33-2]|uniref:glycerophosphodiester phosphodiesterase n=1 Tax=Bacillus sp. T33-2 TaxID=2054168 RepID=UPI000C782A84|nr:glycerophosphodiester phosphodiesterase family protein [Bacillus sp. T33-2]PLR97535.1 glycerophosphodiester phosphodiesterase [Bacillus sp. T33-2]
MRFLLKANVFLTSFLALLHRLEKVLNIIGGGRNKPVLIGHRGAAGYCPENTMVSFEKAIEMNADMLEFDVQETRDGVLVVIHDPTVDRTTNGKGKVRGFSFQELQQLDAGSWFSTEFAGAKIPSFNEVLERYGGKVKLLIELKKPSLYPGIEEKVADELVKRGLHQPNGMVIVQSFDSKSMKRFKEMVPSIPVGVLVRHDPRGISNRKIKALSSFASYLNPKITMANKSLVKRIHGHGLKTITWTVRDEHTAKTINRLGFDGIATDYLDYFE